MDNQKIKPNLFIVGAAKSGTSSLWQYLRQHPNIFMPADELYKEPAYFSIKGCHRSYEEYLRIFGAADKSHRWIGEASTAYLTDPTSPKRIYEFNPTSKIIILLRNPADRAYSLYNWMVQDGYEYACSFEKALRLEDQRITKKIPNWFEPEYYWNYMYFNSGLYYQQVKRYLDLFGDNVLVVKVDDFRRAFSTEYVKICSFLELKPNKVLPRIYNKSRQVYSAQGQFVLRKVTTDFLRYKVSPRKYGKAQILNLIIRRFAVNATTFCKATGTSIHPISTPLILIRIIAFISKNDLDFDRVLTKNQRDILLTMGLKSTKPRILNDSTRKKLLLKYSDDVLKLERLLNIDLKQWSICGKRI